MVRALQFCYSSNRMSCETRRECRSAPGCRQPRRQPHGETTPRPKTGDVHARSVSCLCLLLGLGRRHGRRRLSRGAYVGAGNLRAIVAELAGDLLERNFKHMWIGANIAAAYRSLYARQLDMELVGELVTQPVRRHTELTLGNAGLLHHVVEALEGLLQRQAWMSHMR